MERHQNVTCIICKYAQKANSIEASEGFSGHMCYHVVLQHPDKQGTKLIGHNLLLSPDVGKSAFIFRLLHLG